MPSNIAMEEIHHFDGIHEGKLSMYVCMSMLVYPEGIPFIWREADVVGMLLKMRKFTMK